MAIDVLDHRHEFLAAPVDPVHHDRSTTLFAGTGAMVTAALLWLIQLIVVDRAARAHDSTLRDALTQWDAAWMGLISDHGYAGFSYSDNPAETIFQSVAFFPGYPVLVRMVAAPFAVLGVEDSTLIAALITSAVSSLVLAWGISVLTMVIWSRCSPHAPSRWTAAAVSVASSAVVFGAPMGIAYWMPYSEATFTALAVWALVALIRRRYGIAAVLVLIAGVTRLTGIALVVTLALVAVIELISYWRRRGTLAATTFPWAAVTAPLIGALGIGSYLLWASAQTRSAGGYFAIQDRGWGSGWDWGVSTIEWIGDHVVGGFGDATQAGYTISIWSMLIASVLCVVALWPVLRGRLPWQIWVASVGVAGIVLGSGGVMHSRPRLLLIPMALLAMGAVVLAISAAAQARGRRRWLACGSIAAVTVAWCVVGIWVSTFMLIDFDYGI